VGIGAGFRTASAGIYGIDVDFPIPQSEQTNPVSSG
jgi:hypothetical protein